MIDCLNSLVGIRTDCGEQTPSDSGLYIQDLAFINLKVADSIVTTQDSGVALLQSKLAISQNYLVNDIQTKMAPYFKGFSVVQNDIAGYVQDDMNVDAALADTYKGIQLKVVEYPFLSVYISSISLFTDFTGDVDVKIFDLIQNKLLDTITVTSVANEIVTVDIHKEYMTNGQVLNLFIGYDSTGINGYETTVFNQGYSGYVGCKGCSASRNMSNKYALAYSKSIPTTSQIIERNLQSLSHTGGLSITYSLSCSLEKWICQNRNRFAMALLHRWGMEVLKEFSISSRVNALVTLKKDEANNLSQYYEQEYNKAMANCLQNLRLPNDICFECNKRVTTGVIVT